VGGGEIIGQRLTVTLPYRNWGSLRVNPERGGEISQYIIRVAKPMWDNEYDMDITYNVLHGSWQISGQLSQGLKEDLKLYGLPGGGNFRATSDLSILETCLDNHEKIKRFIAGLTDTVGSLAPSHRHRVNSSQIISYEFTGKNFSLVSQLARIFSEIGCPPNQILWNHPNFHSGTDRYYKSWKKGFKLRIALTDYMLAGSFVSEAKKLSAKENIKLTQAVTSFNHTDTVRINGRTTLHIDEYSNWLQDNIRGKHFIHYTHLAHLLGVPVNATALNYLKEKLKEPETLICPFTILTKGTCEEIDNIIQAENYLSKTKFNKINIGSDFLSKCLVTGDVVNVLGIDNDRGFPLAQVIHAVTFVALAETKSKHLMGNRILGERMERFTEIEPRLSNINVEILKPNKGTCLLIRGKSHAALVGYSDDSFNKSLIECDSENLILKIREPQYEECVDL
jgi:hypothetical protein